MQMTLRLQKQKSKSGAGAHGGEAGGAADEGVVGLLSRILQQRGGKRLAVEARRLRVAHLRQELLCHCQAAAHNNTPICQPPASNQRLILFITLLDNSMPTARYWHATHASNEGNLAAAGK